MEKCVKVHVAGGYSVLPCTDVNSGAISHKLTKPLQVCSRKSKKEEGKKKKS